MDREDYMYAGAILLVGVGIGWFHPGAGLACAGGMLALCPVISMLRNSSPPKGPE